MRWLAVTLAVAAGACDTPPLKIRYQLASDGDQSCAATTCADIKLPCDAVLNLRILDPDDPSAPHVSICEAIPPNRNGDLCAISQIKIAQDPATLPKRTLEVQLLIWPREVVEGASGQLDCRKYAVEFDAVAGLPVSQFPAPAIGGRAFYQPGDTETIVPLGCTDLRTLETCTPPSKRPVMATVDDFDNVGVSVSRELGSRLNVDIGEPVASDDVFKLEPSAVESLDLILEGTSPAWSAEVPIAFTNTACLQVLESTAQATAAVTCRRLRSDEGGNELIRIDGGLHVAKPRLQQVLAALALPAFPERGLTLGLVVDAQYNRVAGRAVTASSPSGAPVTIKYLAADGMSAGGTATSANGIFIAQDAPFGTMFGVAGSPTTPLALGGLLEGKVTAVLVQLAPGE